MICNFYISLRVNCYGQERKKYNSAQTGTFLFIVHHQYKHGSSAGGIVCYSGCKCKICFRLFQGECEDLCNPQGRCGGYGRQGGRKTYREPQLGQVY